MEASAAGPYTLARSCIPKDSWSNGHYHRFERQPCCLHEKGVTFENTATKIILKWGFWFWVCGWGLGTGFWVLGSSERGWPVYCTYMCCVYVQGVTLPNIGTKKIKL